MAATRFSDEIVLVGLMADLGAVSDFIAASCARAGVRPTAQFDLELAVEEACTNVIEHAYAGRGGEFSVHFEALDGDIVVTVRDRGRAFDPSSVAAPDFSVPLEERPIGGLGLHLMHRLMDEVAFSFSAEGNTLTLVKRNALAEQDGP